MKSIKQLSIKILNAVKAYFRKLVELQQEAIKFQNDMEKELWRDKK